MADLWTLLSVDGLQTHRGGPLYVKLRQVLAKAIATGVLGRGEALPAERDIADRAGVSRVTVRRAIDTLVEERLLVRRHGSGTFVANPVMRMEQPLAGLTSFSEEMARRGLAARSEWMEIGVFPPSLEEIVALGIPSTSRVARLDRLRIADDLPLAVERSSISAELLPDPGIVTASLYAALEQLGIRPERAIQKISACSLRGQDAKHLQVPDGTAGLAVQRISYLSSGKVVEFTRSLFRGDAYDFIVELKLP